jgi:pimeloyl-ACP methyl ester carboxylesterase
MDDIDLFSLDPEFEKKFHSNHGPENETTIQYIKRIYSNLCKRICEPERLLYEYQDLFLKSQNEFSEVIEDLYEVTEFDQNLILPNPKNILTYSVTSLHCVLWKLKTDTVLECPCIIYLHTNTRNLTDAVEILPLCATQRYHVFAFDLPSHGKSDAVGLSALIGIQCIEEMISFLTANYGMEYFYIWARGMSTNFAIEYCNLSKDTDSKTNIDRVYGLVLDTPFTSVKDIVRDVMDRFSENGYYIPSPVTYVATSLVRGTLKKQTGFDPYEIQPIQFVEQACKPCVIIAALRDDYVKADHSYKIKDRWSIHHKQPCKLYTSSLGVFDHREVDLMLTIGDDLIEMKADHTRRSGDAVASAILSNPSNDTNAPLSNAASSSKKKWFWG